MRKTIRPSPAVIGFAAAVLFFPSLSRAQDVRPSTAPVLVERIVFRGNRTSEGILRKHLPFSEGQALAAGSLQKARENFWDMKQFKRVEVSSSTLPDGNAAVTIDVQDGWYLLPLPMAGGGSGGSRAGLIVSEMNAFGQAESAMASAFTGSAGSSASIFLLRERKFVSASARRSAFTERRYADGAFSAVSGSGRPQDDRDIGHYGTVAESYRKAREETSFVAGFPLSTAGRRADLSAAFGWERARLNYSDPSPLAPDDPGRHSEAFAGLRSGGRGGGALGSDSLGALFGFGLADMERRLAPLPAARFDTSGEVSWHMASAWTGADFGYGYFLARWDSAVTWGTHRSLSLRLAGGHGGDLPASRLLATGRAAGLAGAYAREYRGNSAAGASLAYSHPFRITRRGMWQGSVFAEAARAWGAGPSGSKTGAGASFWYRFWRFPLPFGFSWTYSFDDRDIQVSAAFGGRF